MLNLPVPAVEVVGLTHRFGSVLAVDRLSLTVPPGMFYGIVGPNGAGKTTTLTAVCGLREPTSGTIRIAGHDLRTDREAALAQLGIMMDGLSLPERLTATEALRYSAGLRGLDDGWQARASDLLEILRLDAVPRTLIVEYSTGMRKKINLALALLHRPRVLVLDEPFEAIDPVSAHSIEQVLKQYVDAGGTVLLSSHIMDFVERNCRRVAVVAGGRVLVEGRVEELTAGATLNERFIELVGADPVRPLEWLR
ncbi:Daunorubicin/doxorubicin resistance ATP-binding protein DrrA [Nonomuraea coxensis DSM 45129]|uniref:Daunorubicin/doxorubicin resistance ATP-binding protein DrrA n=1 Tax=Nonomuraea coxensis DSM 45129 TaxID=1122611 RepID=A0ABX8UA01_9ACTN|nr:ABC transporter ATP-binding protein [Nonomuraea coxensis]QYC44261.1 Daunorubicin/doxorubicin resistance ATP-binding protein DrrA [Nonomuraea coxensis DSM 45129]